MTSGRRAEQLVKFAFKLPIVIFPTWLMYAEWHGLYVIHLLHYDYGFSYYAFESILHGYPVNMLYNPRAQQHFLVTLHFPYLPHNQYVYPPQFAVFLCPLGIFPFSLSADIWMAMSILLYSLGVFWISRVLWPRLNLKYIALLILGTSVLTPFQFDIGVGNVNCVLFSAVALSFYLLYYKRRAWWAGVPLGLAISFKVTPAAVLGYMMLRKQWRVSLSALGTVVIMSGITVLFLGSTSLIQYVEKFTKFGQTSMMNGPAPYNQSLIGVLGAFVQHNWLHWPSPIQNICFLIFVLVTGFVFLWVILHTPANPRMDMGLASLAPVVFSPLVEQPHMVYVLPTILSLVSIAQWAKRENARSSRNTYRILTAVTVGAFLALSLPTTFTLNYLVNHWPQLFWVQTHMFWVLVLLFASITWQSLLHQELDVDDTPICNRQVGDTSINHERVRDICI